MVGVVHFSELLPPVFHFFPLFRACSVVKTSVLLVVLDFVTNNRQEFSQESIGLHGVVLFDDHLHVLDIRLLKLFDLILFLLHVVLAHLDVRLIQLALQVLHGVGDVHSA